MADRIGKQVGNYHLTRLLGAGGFAEVYLGEHIYLDTLAAVKVLRTQLVGEEINAFRMEGQMVARLEHPHIVRVLDFGVEENIPFLVMGYAANGTLRQRHPKGTALPLTTIVSYVKQVTDALQYAHEEKLIHRDIKPENMLLDHHDAVLLSDFGIALIAQSTDQQSTQEVAGTIAYMAPEMLQGKPTFASDQYALGVVVYEWLCGERPFHGSFTELAVQHMVAPPPSLRERVPALSEAIETVVMKVLAKDPKQRFDSVQAFATALELASLQSTPLSAWDVFPQTPQRRQGGGIEENQEETVTRPRVEIAAAELQLDQPTSINQIHKVDIIDSIKGRNNSVYQATTHASSSPSSNQTQVFSSSTLPSGSLKDFFISYNKADRDWARWIASCLQQASYSVLLPPVDFREGFIFRKEMQKALQKAKRMIVVLSPSYLCALKARTMGVNAFKRVMMDKQEILLTVYVHDHEHVREEISGMANYVDITEESHIMAQEILLAYVRGDGIELPTSSSPQSNPTYVPTSELFSHSATVVRTDILQQVKISFSKKDWPDVTRKVDFLIKQHPNTITSEIYRMHGLALVELNNQQRAYESLHTALTLASDQERLTLLEDCVKVLTVLSRWNEVLEYTKEALQLEPRKSFWLTTHQQVISRLTRGEQESAPAGIPMQSMPPLSKGIEVFFSYSHKDEKMRQELEKHLSNLKRQRIITGWNDGEIKAGDIWEEEIEAHLSSANIILLLISPDFIDSNYCYEKEMIRAMERHKAGEACVIPVILRPAHWEGTPFGKLQVLPVGAKAITRWEDRDEAFVSVAKGIQKIVDELKKNFSPLQ